MKSLKTLLLLTIIAFTAVQCAKEGSVGPQGNKGEQGENGIAGEKGKDGNNGKDGNANVRLYRFKGEFNFSTTDQQFFECPSAIDSTVNSLWTIYIISSEYGLTYYVPGFGLEGASNYRAYLNQNKNLSNIDTVANWIVDKDSGPGETYDEVRIFRVYANAITESGTQINNKAIYNGFTAAEVKQMNYQEFCNNFGVKE